MGLGLTFPAGNEAPVGLNRSLRAPWLMGSHSRSPAPREGFWELGLGRGLGVPWEGRGQQQGP